MKMTAKSLGQPLMKGKSPAKKQSLAYLAAQAGMPLGTLKTRVKKLVDAGIARERAIEIALSRPIAPQGRPRHSPR